MISFGPVPSRRLGKSLGINNIVSPKICSYSCIYCQVGITKIKSIARDSFYKPEMIYEQVVQHLGKLNENDIPEYLTFVSNGEPTLDINLGKSITLLKKTGIPVAVISNASMLFDEPVRNELSLADWVSLKMDAADNSTWQKLNNPAQELDFTRHIDNINIFARDYKGKLNTETMLVKGVNDSVRNISGVSELIKQLNPYRAYLSIPTRPPAEKSIKPPEMDKLNRAFQIFNEMKINTELLTGFEGTSTGYTGNIYEDILTITSVHPLREDSMTELLKKDKADFQVVESLLRQRLIIRTIYNGKKYYIRDFHVK